MTKSNTQGQLKQSLDQRVEELVEETVKQTVGNYAHLIQKSIGCGILMLLAIRSRN